MDKSCGQPWGEAVIYSRRVGDQSYVCVHHVAFCSRDRRLVTLCRSITRTAIYRRSGQPAGHASVARLALDAHPVDASEQPLDDHAAYSSQLSNSYSARQSGQAHRPAPEGGSVGVVRAPAPVGLRAAQSGCIRGKKRTAPGSGAVRVVDETFVCPTDLPVVGVDLGRSR